MNRQEMIQIGILVTTLIVICVMIFAIVTLVKHADEIRDNPVDYAIKNSNIEYCVCYNDEGKEAHFGEVYDPFDLT